MLCNNVVRTRSVTDPRQDGATNKVYFAAVGDVHGQFVKTIAILRDLEREFERRISFVLQVGDIESHRNPTDVDTMAAPTAKKREHVGDFKAVYQGEVHLDCPWYFIGGNHECYGFLDAMVEKGGASQDEENGEKPEESTELRYPYEVAESCYYLGRAGHLALRMLGPSHGGDSTDDEVLGLLNLAFISGIYQEGRFYERRPRVAEFGCKSNKLWIGFNCYDVARILDEDSELGTELAVDVSLQHSTYEALVAQAILRCLGRDTYFDLASEGCGQDHTRTVDSTLLSRAEVRAVMRYLVSDEGLTAKVDQVFAHVAEQYRKAAAEPSACSDGTRDISRVSLGELVAYFSTKTADYSAKKKQRFLDAFERKNQVDVLITHDWPAGLVEDENLRLRGSRPMGNAIARRLLDECKPKFAFCGHMHFPYRRDVRHGNSSSTGDSNVGEAGGRRKSAERSKARSREITSVCCLSKVPSMHSVTLFEWDLDTGCIREFPHKAEGLDCLISQDLAGGEEESDLD
eukprot:gnl/TRDRNA2_/TRDRNA2_160576_c0_seq1.p1 gnl/TRDRNA2_/TRDRNA2_160576_c0~~gnl/TRDRNA2_/TRDRNA2_160576_c0_seq1.p1  ORF type:complete len:517 (-),score=65.89 gnl/TRDRNA2_/TRDRNA2_160576_c0_seq1:17-1567(-)